MDFNMNQLTNKRVTIFHKTSKLIFLFFVFQLLIELILFLGGFQFRDLVVGLFGFNPALLNNGDPFYLGQQFLMFLTHTCIHSNFSHMLINVVIFISLGNKIAKDYNGTVALGIFFFSAIIGALIYFFLSSSNVLMIGASGGIFGYFGFWKTLEFLDKRKFNLSVKPIIAFVLILILVNITFNSFLDGRLAWQAHLGGFIAGGFCVFLINLGSSFKET